MKWLLAVTVVAFCAFSRADEADDATRKCLDCICYASTKCDPKAQCNAYCGPYQISDAYWIDAGRPQSSIGFARCAQERACAEETVIQYMNRWGTDCDGDGAVTCYDYARMHKAGRTGCQAPWVLDTPYWTQFNQCMGRGQGLDARGR